VVRQRLSLLENGQTEVLKMRLSKRVENLPPYLFVEIIKKIAEKKAKGLAAGTSRQQALTPAVLV